MGFWGKVGKIAAVGGLGALAPFTGGASLAVMPALIGAGTAIAGGALAGQFGGGGAGSLSKEQKGLIGPMTGLASQQGGYASLLSKQAAQSYKMGQPAYQQGLSYYQRLLHGDRAAQAQVTSPQVANINDVYGGAERNLERQGIRGGEAATALAEIGRSRARDISGLTVGVQPMAAGQVSNLGYQAMQDSMQRQTAASGALGAASNTYASLLPGAQQRQQAAYGEGNETGKAIAGMVTPMLQKWATGRTASGPKPSYGGASYGPQKPVYGPPSGGFSPQITGTFGPVTQSTNPTWPSFTG